jgi:choline transport protein
MFADCIAKLVVFWVMGDRGGAEVFTTFSSNGWPTVPISCLVGILGPVQTLIGSDAQAHLAEETEDAARVVPRFVATVYERVDRIFV